MKIGVTLPAEEPEGTGDMPGWPEIRSFAQNAERLGFDSLWMFDHFFYQPDEGPLQGVHEAWTLMAAVAAVTERAEIGALVMCSSFRHPSLMAKMAATLDEVSGGRLILGLGAGWHDPEYDAFGFPKDHRVDRFEEALQVIVPLLAGERVTFAGTYFQTEDAVLAPPPPRRTPLLVASEGPRMLRLTARYADSWNTAWFGAPDDSFRERFDVMDAALLAEGRDPATLERTVGVTIIPVGDISEEPALEADPAELAAAFEAYRDLGADHLILSLYPTDEELLEQVAAALPH